LKNTSRIFKSVVLLTVLFGAFESHSQIIKYLNKEWLVYDQTSKYFFPYVTGNKAALPLHQNLSASKYKGMFLVVKSTSPVSLYINSQYTIECPTNRIFAISIDSLALGKSEPLLLSFYGTFNQTLVDSLSISSQKDIPFHMNMHNPNIPQPREGITVRSYFALLLMFCFLIFVVVKNSYDKMFDYYFGFLSLFRESPSDFSNSRVTFDSYYFAFLFLGVLFFALGCLAFPIFNHPFNESFLDLFGQFLYFIFIIILFYAMKYFVIYLTSWLFSINKFSISHFVCFTRISVTWASTLLLLAMLNFSNVNWTSSLLLPTFVFSSLFYLTLTSVKVTLLINRVAKVSTLYLISYLCITEWLPYIIIVKLYMVYFY